MNRDRLTRRSTLTLLAGSALTLPTHGWGQGGSGIGGTGIDAGIGGTGLDSGIGGTGIYGLIEGFSSIWVNDVRIEIPNTATITLNGRPASESELSLGQTVAVEAVQAADGTFTASRIDATFALLGPISQIGKSQGLWILKVLGQYVILPSFTETMTLRSGDWVVVTGLRDHRGIIQAANVQQTTSREAIVTGPVTRNGRVAGVPVVLLDGVQLYANTRATVRGYLSQEAEPRLVVREAVTRPRTIFDPTRLKGAVLSGLPGEQDGTLYVDGVSFSLPGTQSRKDPSLAGVEGRIHGRFAFSGRDARPLGGPSSPKRPRAPFAGRIRDGPGRDRPAHRSKSHQTPQSKRPHRAPSFGRNSRGPRSGLN